MQKCLIIRFGEIFLKKKNRSHFIRKLVENLNRTIEIQKISSLKIKIHFDHLLIFTEKLPSEELIILCKLIKQTFGVGNFYSGYLLEKNVEKLFEFSNKLIDFCPFNFVSFKFDVHRIDKKFYPNSLALSRDLGNIIRQRYKLKVDLSNPEKTFYVRVYREYILFLLEKENGLGGLPLGSSGKVLLLLSGGIDSPVAAYHLMRKGCQIVYCHFYVKSQGQDKIQKIIEKLSPYNNHQDEFYLINFNNLLLEISHISQPRYRLIILKRAFIRLASELAKEINAKAIATGDSLSQVASQTIESIKVIYQVSSFLTLHPLITADKQTIIKEALRIGTYELSILPYEDCCSLFSPLNPIIKPNLIEVEKMEKEIFLDLYSLKNVTFQKINAFSRRKT